ncbi:MAG: radical SAM protein [Isosphaeraceae bacterium]|jgi:radical SAM superfamily enzyme YgiQ (UPF0313 family)
MIGHHLRSLTRELRPSLSRSARSRRLWLDLGELGSLARYQGEDWQDHGLGLLRTMMHQNGLPTELASVRNARNWDQVTREIRGYDMLLMNVRSYNYDVAVKSAALFKQQNPNGLVLVGGTHTTVSPEEMEATPDFDRICKGPGEGVILDLVRDPAAFPRVFEGKSAKSMAEWPMIDRTLWPKPSHTLTRFRFQWPLERGTSWGPQPQVSMLTSRVCPWACSFCNEASYIPRIERRPVEMVIDELNELDEKYDFGSVTIHDSMFFQNPKWLKTWLDLYPKRARRLWPYWAAARADTVLQWPELFEAIVKETNWNVVSIGFEANSDRMLRVLNKEITKQENEQVVALINRIGDDQEKAGKNPVKMWANVMFGIPGETRDEAFETYRLMKKMRRAYPSVAFYTAYPGSALGYQIIAEGKDQKHLHVRDASSEPIKGIDYAFYRALLRGEYEEEVNRPLAPEDRQRSVQTHAGLSLSEMFGA